MQNLVLVILVYYMIFSTSYAKVTAILPWHHLLFRKSQNSCLLIFLENRPHYLPKYERILFIEVFFILFYVLQCLKRRFTGGWSRCRPLRCRALGQSALRLS